MQDRPNQPDATQDNGLNVPKSLARDLADLADARVFVPREVDEAVLADAREHQQTIRLRTAGSRRAIVGFITGAAAAAAVGLTVWLMPGESNNDPSAIAIQGDLNGDGVVNIVDAMLLEQRYELDEGVFPDRDFNGDGQLDRADAHELAHRAVALPSEERGTL